jgi:trans-2,3-dihydro-3-hydroxyanthranilate isomerase
MGTKFFIVDVFAEQKYAGNQLAVFRDAENISDADMQKIAKEMHFSETTFILSDHQRDGGYDVRIFTPEQELPFAGHPTLGTAYVIQTEIIKEPVDRLQLNLKVGKIPVTFDRGNGRADLLWMKQMAPTFGRELDRAAIAEVLNLDERGIDDRFPVRVVSTGVPVIIAPLRSLDCLKRAQVARDRYFDLIAALDAKAILVFSGEPHEPQNDLSVRFFADYFGVPEDPATGSANGCLAAYLVKQRYFGKDRIDVRAEQGYEMGRPSLLLLKAEDVNGSIDVSVGGRVIGVATGELI